ncbi:ImmA/IrrE family metallo-endopeptidase [Planomicrobium okeanokoites]|uniref:ImmA/IrrE family metallo-endopeptidase n=1 Tax=Planomicrobium okeanokoites TaxID=244 RepID=UPI0009FE356B|nr:ImmA/IrrE family metallo-endopeptidase [Planomicrobium okeanokoites]
MANTYNNLEEYIQKLLHRIDIYHPHQLNMEDVYSRLGMSVHYIQQDAMFVFGYIFLDSRKSAAEQWEDFGHELCHALWHAGNQALIPLSMREYQEWKAENFAQHLCIPSFMLDSMKLPNHTKEAVWMLQEEFGVTQKFSEKRLERYMRNLQSSY